MPNALQQRDAGTWPVLIPEINTGYRYCFLLKKTKNYSYGNDIKKVYG